MSNPLISIIIPMYNCSQYIEKCISSALNQSYQNLEILCVDDGSIDNTYEVVQKINVSDPRVKLIRQRNMGVSGARNTGVYNSSGEYILFIDSDDWLPMDVCEIVIKQVTIYNYDAVFWPYNKVYDNEIIPQRIFEREQVFNDEASIRKNIHRRLFGPLDDELKNPEKVDCLSTVHCKLYRSEIIKDENIKFEDLKIIGTSEDTIFNIDYFNFAKSALFINKPLYFHNKSNTESITSVFKPKLKQKWDKLFLLMSERVDLDFDDESYFVALQNRRALSLIGLGINEVLSTKNIFLKYRSIQSLVRDHKLHSSISNLNLSNMPIHWRVFFVSASLKITSLVLIQLLVIKFLIKK